MRKAFTKEFTRRFDDFTQGGGIAVDTLPPHVLTASDRKALFDEQWQDWREPNEIAMGKPVCSNGNETRSRQVTSINDGVLLRRTYWGGVGGPVAEIDLVEMYDVDRIKVFPLHGSYTYTVEVSVDGGEFKTVVPGEKKETEIDKTKKICDHRLSPIKARFVRIKGLAHILDVKVYKVTGSKSQEPPPNQRILAAAKAEREIARGKPAKSSGDDNPSRTAKLITDGREGKDSAWWGKGNPQWVQVDLEKEYEVDEIWLQPWWDNGENGRAYKYTIEASINGKTWQRIVDRSKNTTPHRDVGESYILNPFKVRYVRVTGINHLCEMKVYRHGSTPRK